MKRARERLRRSTGLARRKYLDAAETHRLLNAAKGIDEATYLLVYAMLNLGLRVGEAVAMTWTDLGDGVVKIRTEKQRGDVVDEMPAPREVIDRIGELHDRICRAGPPPHHSSCRIFAFGVRAAQIRFDKAARAAGVKVPRRGTHCLRHTFGLHATKASNGNPIEVARLLRHSSTRHTEVYMHTVSVAELRTKMGDLGE